MFLEHRFWLHPAARLAYHCGDSMQPNDKRILLAMVLGLWLSTLLLFSPARNYGFITYDDGKYVNENEMVMQGLNAETIKWAITGPHFHMWHPLTSLSHLLDVQLFGMNPGAHHLVNILIHSLNAVLLLLLLLRATGDRWASLFVAALFAWHPLRVESVVWIAERKDVLCTLFWLLTFHAYLQYVRSGSKRAYWLTVGVYALGIMTKPMIVTLPCVLLLLDFWPLNRFKPAPTSADTSRFYPFQWNTLKPLLVEKIPFFILCAVLSALTYKMQKEGDVLTMMESTSFVDRFGNAMVSYLRYAGKVLWPVDLAVLYPHPGKLPYMTMLLAFSAIVFVTLLSWVCRITRPWLAVGWLWFLGIIVPASGIIQAGGAAMADRYTYVSTIGLLIIFVWAGKELLRISPWGRHIVSGLAGIALAGCWITTTKQIHYWQDTETLFRHTTQVTKNNSIAIFVLGHALLEQNRPLEAIDQFAAGLKINPDDPKAWLQMGRAQTQQGNIGLAVTCFREALQIDPKLIDAQFQLATVLAQSGQSAEAESEFAKYLKQNPTDVRAWNNFGNVQFLQQKYTAAEASYLQAAKLEPAKADTWMNLANLFLQQNNGPKGLAALERALQLRPDDARLWYQYANICEQFGASSKAVAAFRQVLALEPEQPNALIRLAWRLAVDPDDKVRNGKEALAIAEKMVLQSGGTPGPYAEILAAAKAENGLYKDAIFWAETAKKVYEEGGDTAGKTRLEKHLKNYRQNKPWRTATTP